MERPDWETNWQPLRPDEARELLQDYPGRWWIAGGWAIDLFAGEPYREHADIDIELLRSEHHLIHDALPGWEIYACRWPNGEILHRWHKGDSLPAVVHDIWCRPAAGAPWAFQFMVLDDEGDRWLFRRDHRIGGAIDDLARWHDGLPVLTPEVQLLFKSKGRRSKDERDFQRALPLLDTRQREWLREALAVADPENPWLTAVKQEES